MDWSYRLLTPDEQAGLRALTVFPGDFDLAAAAAVVPPSGGSDEDLIFRLIDKSLVVVRRRAGEVRYRLLETVRSFAAGSSLTTVRATRPVDGIASTTVVWRPDGASHGS